MSAGERPGPSNSVERRNSGFGVEILYKPQFLYALLTKANKPCRISLDNNWAEISDKELDPISQISVSIDSDLKIKYQDSWPDRATKIFWGKGNIQYHWRKDNLDILFPKEEQGRWSLYPGYATSIKQVPALNSLKAGQTFPRDFSISDVQNRSNNILNGPDDIKRELSALGFILEKTIRTIYRLEGKPLPLKKLVFAPRPGGAARTNAENIELHWAMCSYCHNLYSLSNGLACPGCGAFKPILVPAEFVKKAFT